MGAPLATVSDVQLLYTPLIGATTDVQNQVTGLIAKASAILRQALPWVDSRIARFNTNPSDVGGLDPVLVADVIATMVKRFLVNQSGATNQSETVGPYSHSTGFVIRGEKHVVLGELYLSDADLDKLRGPVKMVPKMGTAKIGASGAMTFGESPFDMQRWGPGMGEYVPDGSLPAQWVNPPNGTP